MVFISRFNNKYNKSDKINMNKYVMFNHFIKLNENKEYIDSKFRNLFKTAVKYHSKECFDIIINQDNIISNLHKHYCSLHDVFQNYIMAPNENNKYYINMIIDKISLIDSTTLQIIVQNNDIFHIIFNKLIKNENIFIYILDIILLYDCSDAFTMVYDHLKVNNYDFFNDTWINNNILLNTLIYDSINIIKILETNNIDITNIIISDTRSIPSLVISLYTIYNSEKDDSLTFKYLLSKINNIDINILWVTLLPEFFPTDKDIYKLHNDFNLPEHPYYYEDNNNIYYNINKMNNMPNFSSDILAANLIEYLNEDQEYNDEYNLSDIINTIYFLLKNNNNEMVKNMLDSILLLPNLNIIERLSKNIFKIIKNIDRMKIRRSKFRHTNNIIKIKIKRIENCLNIISYYKTNNNDIYNPLNKDIIHIKTNNKKLLRDTINKLIEMKFPITDDFKSEILMNIFTTKQIENFNKPKKVINKKYVKKNKMIIV
jgi:hypothetical protein